jgi:uronate dehydrogenase
MDVPAKPVLLTGASGRLGRVLAQEFAAQGWPLRLTDIVPFPGAVPAGAVFTQADLNDGAAILRLAEGSGTILHFGGIAADRPFETVLGPNIRGVHNAYEAARCAGARMVFASSNHVTGFYERTEVLDHDAYFRPDSYYGLSKAYGELMGRLYWDKHGIESVFLRIGPCRAEPDDARCLSAWLSHGDLVRVVRCSVLAETTGRAGCAVIWCASKNQRMTWWRQDARGVIGWSPEDSADPFTAGLADKTSGDPVVERYQGGNNCGRDYSRAPPAPGAMFDDGDGLPS